MITGIGKLGNPVYLHEIWPSRATIQEMETQYVSPAIFKDVYSTITAGSEAWNELPSSDTVLYPWDELSTYIKKPLFFTGITEVRLSTNAVYHAE